MNSVEGHSEPSWFKDIKFDDSNTEQLADDAEYTTPSMYRTSDALIKHPRPCLAGLDHRIWIYTGGLQVVSQPQLTELSLSPDSASPSKRTSVSSFQSVVDSDSAASINLNMEQNNVNFHIKKQSKYPHVPAVTEQKGKHCLTRSYRSV